MSMPRFCSKPIHNITNHDDLKLNKNKQSIDANNKMKRMLELSDKDFKAAMIKKRIFLVAQW